MKRDLNELYNMVCTDRNEYLQAVQAVVTFSGLYEEELQKVLPKLQGPQPELTLNDIRGYTPYEERDMSPYEGGQPLDDIIMGGSERLAYEPDRILARGGNEDLIIDPPIYSKDYAGVDMSLGNSNDERLEVTIDFPDFMDANFANFDPILPQVDNDFFAYANTDFKFT